MARIAAENIQQLVAKAFVLEAISDKPGCTTRYADLPGKPLQDFVIAGINSSAVIGEFAQAFKTDPTIPVFRYNLQALQVSNTHKSAKFINFGLLEIMFPAVAARLINEDPNSVVDEIISIIKEPSPEDVQAIVATRTLAWSTSQTNYKKLFDSSRFANLQSVWEFYMLVNEQSTKDSSNFHWSEQFKNSLPILRTFFDDYSKAGELLQTTTKTFKRLRKEFPEISVGILADMCAAAMFLWLSYNTQPA